MADVDPYFGPGKGVVLAAILAVAAVTELLVPMTDWSQPRSAGATPEFDDARDTHLVHGLNAPDVTSLAERFAEQGQSVTVASRPSLAQLDAPLYTRTEEPPEWLPRQHRNTARLEPLQGGWTRVLPESPEIADAPSIRRARVWVGRDGTRHRCVRSELERFQCDVPGWAFTGTRDVKIRGKDRTCIWSHPLEGRTTIVEYGKVSPSDGGDLRIKTAIDDRAVGDGGPVDVKVRWGDRVTSHEQPDEKGWTRSRLAAPASAAPLTVEIHAESVGRRHFCYRLNRR